jgi:hypothetical protein
MMHVLLLFLELGAGLDLPEFDAISLDSVLGATPFFSFIDPGFLVSLINTSRRDRPASFLCAARGFLPSPLDARRCSARSTSSRRSTRASSAWGSSDAGLFFLTLDASVLLLALGAFLVVSMIGAFFVDS